jgi:hypothetical protein
MELLHARINLAMPEHREPLWASPYFHSHSKMIVEKNRAIEAVAGNIMGSTAC